MDRSHRRARRAARTAGRPLPPGPGRRRYRDRDAARRPVRAAGPARLRAARRRGRRPDVAGTRRDAGDRRRRGDRALPARGCPVHAPAAPGHVRDADDEPASAPARRGDARRSRVLRDVYAEPAAGRRDDLEPARADQRRADGAADASAPEPRRGGSPQSRRRRGSDRSVRDRPRLPPGRRVPQERLRVAAIARGRLPRLNSRVFFSCICEVALGDRGHPHALARELAVREGRRGRSRRVRCDPRLRRDCGPPPPRGSGADGCAGPSARR